MGIFKKMKKALKGAAESGKKKAEEAGTFVVDVNVKAAEFTGEVAQKSAGAVADGAETVADKAGETLTPKTAPRKL